MVRECMNLIDDFRVYRVDLGFSLASLMHDGFLDVLGFTSEADLVITGGVSWRFPKKHVYIFGYGYCGHPNLYQSILMVPGLSDDHSRLSKGKCVLKTTKNLLEFRIRKLSLNLRDVHLISLGVRV